MTEHIIDRQSATWRRVEKWAMERVAACHKDLETASGADVLYCQGRIFTLKEILRMPDADGSQNQTKE